MRAIANTRPSENRTSHFDGLQLDGFHINMSAAFDTGGEEGSGDDGVRVVVGMQPVDTEVWVGSCRVLSQALGRMGRYC